MLPGFRFLVAAIVFSISLTVFGMGAAALLRAAHEQFASNSSWHSTQAAGFTTFLPPAEPAPVLAVLRVEPSPAQPPTPPSDMVEAPPEATVPAEQPSTPAAIASVPENSVPETVAVIATIDPPALPTPSLPAETIDMANASIPPRTVTALDDRIESAKPDRMNSAMAPAIAIAVDKASDKSRLDSAPETAASVVSAASHDVPVAASPVPQVLASADPAMAPAISPSPAPTAPALDPIAAKLAALAEQPAHQDKPAASEHRASVKIASLQLRRSVMKKRQAREKQIAARRANQRRVAQRVRAARQAAAAQQQQQPFPDPFGQQPGFGQPQAVGQQAAGPRTR
ncbi:hypothetical protein LQG66_32435 [Bradyrhizobium ontarionense]|uniref:Uncharacterized protein n=1 Tax=Bradyrhizobium ontarionense TaxID=2898149 RepID=A0ABY3R955_9BRAD|nr:hypothetical protein [Bradyrhizobium sp. A19]UFZ03856.1 hypothetical protein LQG66_32435 [Bradyrhizobium sp. A19]